MRSLLLGLAMLMAVGCSRLPAIMPAPTPPPRPQPAPAPAPQPAPAPVVDPAAAHWEAIAELIEAGEIPSTPALLALADRLQLSGRLSDLSRIEAWRPPAAAVVLDSANRAAVAARVRGGVAPPPAPIVSDRRRLVLVYEKSAPEPDLVRLISQWLLKDGLPDGDWRALDDDFEADEIGNSPEWVRRAYGAVPAGRQPWLIVLGPAKSYSGWPRDFAEFLTIVGAAP
jgi:hypothetical protein